MTAKSIVVTAKVKTFEGYSLLFPTMGTDRLPVCIVAFPPWEIMQSRHQPIKAYNANNYLIVSVFAVASTRLLPLCCHYCHFAVTRNVLILRQYCSSDSKMKEKE